KAHQPRNALNDLVDRRVIPHRPILAIAGDGAEDEAGIDLADRLISEAKAVNDARAEVLDHDIASGNELPRRLSSEIGLEIKDDGLLAGIGADKGFRHPAQLLALGVVPQHIPGRRLYLDDLCPKQAQELGGQGACDNMTEIGDADACEWLCQSCSSLSSLVELILERLSSRISRHHLRQWPRRFRYGAPGVHRDARAACSGGRKIAFARPRRRSRT